VRREAGWDTAHLIFVVCDSVIAPCVGGFETRPEINSGGFSFQNVSPAACRLPLVTYQQGREQILGGKVMEEENGKDRNKDATPENQRAESTPGGAPAEQHKKTGWPGVMPASERPSITVEGMYDIARLFGHKVFTDEQIAGRLRGSQMILRMEYFDPENWGDVEPVVTIDVTKTPIEVIIGECDLTPVIVLRMHAHVAHMFWMRKLNMVTALVRRQIVARGPIPQLLRFLPTIKPSFPIYRETLAELGLVELLKFPPDADEVEEEDK
jgi:hypothetical protein